MLYEKLRAQTAKSATFRRNGGAIFQARSCREQTKLLRKQPEGGNSGSEPGRRRLILLSHKRKVQPTLE